MENKNYERENAKNNRYKVIVLLMAAFVIICTLAGLTVYAVKTYSKKNSKEVSKYIDNKTDNIKNSNDDASKGSDTENSNNISSDYNNNEDEKQSNGDYKEVINEEFENEQQEVVKHFLDSVREMDFKNAYGYTENNKCSLDKIAEVLKQEDTSIVRYHYFFYKMMDYSYYIGDTKVNGNEATVDININTYNFTTTVLDARLHITDAQLASGFSSKSIDEEKKNEIAQKELDELFKDKKRTLSIPVEVKLIKKDNQWKIKEDSVENGINKAIMKNLEDSANAYTDYYQEIHDKNISELSVDSFINYLKSKGINYDPNSQSSPFDN